MFSQMNRVLKGRDGGFALLCW